MKVGDFHPDTRPAAGGSSDSEEVRPEESRESPEALVAETASRMLVVVAELACRLRPFPSFLNMATVQAVELDPGPGIGPDRGCVVVLPGGEICELDLLLLPGIEGVRDFDSVDRMKELELEAEEYIGYAASAIRLLYEELRRRGP